MTDIECDINGMPDRYGEFFTEINELMEKDDLSGALDAFKELNEHYPMIPSLWTIYIKAQEEIGAEASELKELYLKGLKEFKSFELVNAFLLFASTSLPFEEITGVVDELMQVASAHPSTMKLLCSIALDICEARKNQLMELEEMDEFEKLNDYLVKMLERFLKTPMSGLKELWTRYVDEVGEDCVDKTLRLEFTKCCKTAEMLEKMEEAFDDEEDKLVAVENYIQSLKSKPALNSPSRLIAIYERGVVGYPFSEQLWLDYLKYLEKDLKDYNLALWAYDRAVRLCESSFTIAQQSLLAHERAHSSLEVLEEAFERCKDRISDASEGVSLYTTFIYLRRRMGASVKELKDLFVEGKVFLCEEYQSDWDPESKFRRNFAYFLYTKANEPEEAIRLWRDVLASGWGNQASAWLEAVHLERRYGSIVNARRLLYQAVNSVTDKQIEVFEYLMQFEREEGDRNEVDLALEKINAQVGRLSGKPKKPKSNGDANGDAKPKKRKPTENLNAERMKVIKLDDAQGGAEPMDESPSDAAASKSPSPPVTFEQLPKFDTVDGESVENVNIAEEELAALMQRRNKPVHVRTPRPVRSSRRIAQLAPPPPPPAPKAVKKKRVDSEGFLVPTLPLRKPDKSPEASPPADAGIFEAESPSQPAADHLIMKPPAIAPRKPADRNENTARSLFTQPAPATAAQKPVVGPTVSSPLPSSSAAAAAPGSASNTIFLSNMPRHWTAMEVRSHFPNMTDIRLPSIGRGRNKGFAYVDFGTPAEVEAELARDGHLIVDGRNIHISEYKPHAKGEKAEFRYASSKELNKLFVRNVHYDATDAELRAHFAPFGKLREVRRALHPSGKAKGIAYVEFETAAEAEKALEANEQNFKGRPLIVMISDPSAAKKPAPNPVAGNSLGDSTTHPEAGGGRRQRLTLQK